MHACMPATSQVHSAGALLGELLLQGEIFTGKLGRFDQLDQ